ncbi:MAG TPA: DUF4097 family beta strand repeat protein [Candidatus Avipropionibacterium avicola]|uniref:DUF4097 family beta strand repeat protein n=1 Tax=Candidatus Avipropionibacterium avicola TaxID=2840701 RepID=A0A9D1GYE6_9ACTN|nr:DUF4097 family beta strand repeat protein [Candidatus Avipropionibacterium avicola]
MSTTRPIEAAEITHLSVRLGGGSITLDRNTVPGVIGQLTGKRADEFTVTTEGTTLEITAPRGRSTDVHLQLSIPEGIDLTCMVGSADVTADVGLGTVRVRAGSGDIVLDQIGNVDANTGSGDIRIEEVLGSTARVNTGSGEIAIAQCDAALRVRSGSGDIAIGQLRAILQGNSGSGDVRIDATSGNVNARTGSGDVTIGVADGLATWLDLVTSGGDVRVGLDQSEDPGPDTPYIALQVRTGSGDIVVFRA